MEPFHGTLCGMLTTPVVSVFGASRPDEGTTAYAEALKLGTLLANAGFTVATGAYNGVMEAVSRGAHEAGGHVIGITCDRIEQYTQQRTGANQWVLEEIRYSTLRERLYHLVEHCNAAIALSGGIGTLSEIALSWSLLQTGEIGPKPLILVGRAWQCTVKTFLHQAGEYVQGEHQQLLTLVDDETSAVRNLRKMFSNHGQDVTS